MVFGLFSSFTVCYLELMSTIVGGVVLVWIAI